MPTTVSLLKRKRANRRSATTPQEKQWRSGPPATPSALPFQHAIPRYLQRFSVNHASVPVHQRDPSHFPQAQVDLPMPADLLRLYAQSIATANEQPESCNDYENAHNTPVENRESSQRGEEDQQTVPEIEDSQAGSNEQVAPARSVVIELDPVIIVADTNARRTPMAADSAVNGVNTTEEDSTDTVEDDRLTSLLPMPLGQDQIATTTAQAHVPETTEVDELRPVTVRPGTGAHDVVDIAAHRAEEQTPSSESDTREQRQASALVRQSANEEIDQQLSPSLEREDIPTSDVIEESTADVTTSSNPIAGEPASHPIPLADSEEFFRPVDTSSIPRTSAPPLTTATVSMGPVRRAIQQRASGLPTGRITAGTEASRRAQRLRERGVTEQEINADEITESAQQAMPPMPNNLPASLLSEDNPVPATQTMLTEASDKTLPDQNPPDLQESPQHNLPQLGSSPLSPDTLRHLHEIEFDPEPQGQRETEEHQALMRLREQLLTPIEINEENARTPTLVDLPPPPHPIIPARNKTRLSQALARLLENPTGEAQRMVDRVRQSAFVRGVLNHIPLTENLGDSDMVPEFAEVLGTQLDAIRAEAGIAAEDLDAQVQRRREELNAQRAAQEAEAQVCIVDERDQLYEANQHVANTVAGARTAMDERTEEVQASMGGENRRAAIEARLERLTQDVRQHVAQQNANYRRAGQTRDRDLDAGERQQTLAYRYAKQQDEFQLNTHREQIAEQLSQEYRDNVPEGIDPVQYRIQELVSASDDWLQQQLAMVHREFSSMKADASKWTAIHQHDILLAGKNAEEQLRAWAHEQTGEDSDWWDELMSIMRGWIGQAEANAQAWETVQNQETAVVASGYVDMMRQVEAAAREGITEQQILQRSHLTAEEQAIVHAYFNPSDGQVGRDPIGAIAFGIRERIYSQRATELKSRMEGVVLDGSFGVTGMAHIFVLNEVGRAYTSGFDAFGIAMRLHGAFEPGITGWGTDEDEVFAALSGLNSVQVKAVSVAYEYRYGNSLDEDLFSEMDTDGEENRAHALLEGDQSRADAAALHMAMTETFLNTGLGTDRDVIMQTLRNKTPEEIQAIRDAYAKDYPNDPYLDDLIREELDDWATLTTHDADIAAAHLASDTELADVIAIDQSINGFSWGAVFNVTYGTSFEEGSRDEFTAVTDLIRQEVEQQAEANVWNEAQFQAELSLRLRSVEARFNNRYQYHGTLREQINERFQAGPNRDLLTATLDNNEIRADAARVAIETYGSYVYASDDVITDTIERRYTRSLEATRRDLGPSMRRDIQRRLDREDEEYFRTHHQYMSAEDRFERQQEYELQMERELEAIARPYAEIDTENMTAVFEEEYGRHHNETLEQAVRNSTSGYSQDEALKALEQGGYLTRYQRFQYAVGGDYDTTDEEAALQAIQGATQEEIANMDEQWQREHPGETLRDRAFSELSGTDAMDMQIALEGRAMSKEDVLRIERLRVSLEQPDSWHGLGNLIAQPEREILNYRLQELEQNAARMREPVRTEEDRRERDRLLDDFAYNQETIHTAVQQHRARVSAITDSIANTASMIVAIAVGAAITFFSGGSGFPIAAALISSVASTMTGIATRALLMGNQYGHEEFLTDVGMGVVDALVAAATAGIGNRLMGVNQASRAATTALRGPLQALQRAFARMGTVGSIARQIPASRFLTRWAAGPIYKRVIAVVIAESVENAVGALPTAMVAAAIDDRNWEGGFQFGNALTSIGSQVGMSVGMGLGMSGGMNVLGRLYSGARGLIRGPHLGVDVHFTTPDHLPMNDAQYRAALEAYLASQPSGGHPRTQADFDIALRSEYQRHLDNYLRTHPGHTEADFNTALHTNLHARRVDFDQMHGGRQDMDFDVEVGREAGQQIQTVDQQRYLRQQFLDALSDAAPEGRRSDFNDIPVSILSDAEFIRITGKLTGDSAIVVRDGQAHLVVRQGADPASVRQHAAHLADITAPGTAGRVRNPSEALPSDLRGRVNTYVNPGLPARSVQVHYESYNGIITGVWMEIGPGARAIDIQMHANTVRSMRRLQGISGRIRQLINRMRRWAGMNPAAPPGTRAFEAQLELEKLPAIIQERANALVNAQSLEDQLRLMLEVEHLHAQLETHARFVNEVELEPGRGYVAAEGLSDEKILTRLNDITDPQARSLLSQLYASEDREVLRQLLHFPDLINKITQSHASPQHVTTAVNQLLDNWNSLKALIDQLGSSENNLIVSAGTSPRVMKLIKQLESSEGNLAVAAGTLPRIMNKALEAEDPAAFISGVRRIADSLEGQNSHLMLRDISYMTDIDAPNGRVEDFVAAANRLLDTELPTEVVTPLMQSAIGVSERVRLLDGLTRLTTLTDDHAVLRAIGERLNGGNGRNPMTASNRVAFVEGIGKLIEDADALVRDYPQYQGLLPGLLGAANETHIIDKYFQSVDDMFKTLREYAQSDAAVTVHSIVDQLDSRHFDANIAKEIDNARASANIESHTNAVLNALQDTPDFHQLNEMVSILEVLTKRSLSDPDVATRLKPAIEEITLRLGDIEVTQLPPHLRETMNAVIDRVREYNLSVGTGFIKPGDRRISQEYYDFLRGKTPNQTIRDRVNINPDTGKPYTPTYPDPVLPGMMVNGRLHADHIVPMDTIARMPGFEKLTTAQKLEILNLEANFVGLSESANSSKGPKSFEEWTHHQESGTAVDPDFRNKMIAEERRLRGVIQQEINNRVALNEAAGSN